MKEIEPWKPKRFYRPRPSSGGTALEAAYCPEKVDHIVFEDVTMAAPSADWAFIDDAAGIQVQAIWPVRDWGGQAGRQVRRIDEHDELALVSERDRRLRHLGKAEITGAEARLIGSRIPEAVGGVV